jgi:hypothetical protein
MMDSSAEKGTIWPLESGGPSTNCVGTMVFVTISGKSGTTQQLYR